MGYAYLFPAIGLMYLFITNKRQKGNETFGEKIWWMKLRPIHSLFYFLFAYLQLMVIKMHGNFYF